MVYVVRNSDVIQIETNKRNKLFGVMSLSVPQAMGELTNNKYPAQFSDRNTTEMHDIIYMDETCRAT